MQRPEQFKSWAISIVNRQAIDYLRKSNRLVDKQQNYYKENLNNIILDEVDEQYELKTNLLKAIKKLSLAQQLVIKLFYTESYSLKEISEILNISIGTAKSRLFHAREKLKIIIKQ